jgi:Tol biopolymer transport system component
MSIPGNIAPSTIWTVPVGGGEPVAVTTRQSLNASPAWLPDGRHLLFVSNRDGPRDLYVVRVDGSGRPRGEPLRVSTGLEPYSVSVSADGTKAVYSRIQIRRNVWRFPLGASRPLSVRDGQPLTAGNQIVESHALSPDGRWLAFDANLEGNQDIYVVPAEGGELRRLTTDPADDFSPSFSPDGRRIAFHSTRHGTRDILTIDVDGGNLRRLTDHPEQEYHPAYSPDGRHLAYSSAERGGRWIYVMSRDGAAGDWSAPRRLSRGPDTFHARWSPDGHHIVAHTSSAIVTLDLEGNEKIVVSQEGSGLLRAAWAEYSRDGRTIYFLGNDAGGSGLFAVPASGGPPRLVIRYDDPGKPVWLKATIGNGVAYLSVGEFESDVYAMDLEIH